MTQKLTDRAGLRSLAPQHAPVSIPVGSFDIDALKKGLEHAAAGKLDGRDNVVAKAIEGAALEGTQLSRPTSALLPDHQYAEVYNPDLGIIEKTQVYVGAAGLEKPAPKRAARRTNKPVASTVTKLDGEETTSTLDTTKE